MGLIFTQSWLPGNDADIHDVHVGDGLQQTCRTWVAIPVCLFLAAGLRLLRLVRALRMISHFKVGLNGMDLGSCCSCLYVKCQQHAYGEMLDQKFTNHLFVLLSQHPSALSTASLKVMWRLVYSLLTAGQTMLSTTVLIMLILAA